MATSSSKKTGYLLSLLSIFIFSFNTNFMFSLMPTWIEPNGLIVIRCVTSFVFFFVVTRFIAKGKRGNPSVKEKLMMMLGGVLGLGGNLLFYINGLSMVTPIEATIIRTSQPVMIAILSFFFLRDPMTIWKVLGIIVSAIGAVFISIHPNAPGDSSSFLGDLLILGSTITYAFYLVLIKPVVEKQNPFVVMMWMSLASVIITAPFGWKDVITSELFTSSAKLFPWFEVAYIAGFATTIGYWLNLKALDYVTPFEEGVLYYLMPVMVGIVAILMGLQHFSWRDPIALGIIILGFLIMNIRKDTKWLKGLFLVNHH